MLGNITITIGYSFAVLYNLYMNCTHFCTRSELLHLFVFPERTERCTILRQIAEFFDAADNSVDIFEKMLYNNNEL